MGFAEFDRAIRLSDLGPNFRGFQGPRIIHTLRMVWVVECLVECCRIITGESGVTAPNDCASLVTLGPRIAHTLHTLEVPNDCQCSNR
jgi:hypothetical protein